MNIFSSSHLSASYGFFSSSQSTGGLSVSVVSATAASDVFSGTLKKRGGNVCFGVFLLPSLWFKGVTALQFYHEEFK